jgi:hypothetical protein
MRRPGKLEVLTLLFVALIVGGAVSLPASNPMRGWSLDAGTTFRWLAFGERRPPGDSSAGGRANLRPLNVHTDVDDVICRAPLVFSTQEGFVPSLALELASHAMGVAPAIASDGVTLAGEHLASAVENAVAVAFAGGSDDIPSYSLADLKACLDKGDREFFRRHFAGKAVIVGSDIASADQILTSKRFANPLLPQKSERCASPAPQGALRGRSTSGVYFQAMAVDNLIRGERLREFGPAPTLAMSSAAGVGIGVSAPSLGAPVALAGGVVAALIWTAAATSAFQHFIALPLYEPIVSAAATFAAAVALRLGVVDREKTLP